jgi:hypothetical protein
MGSPKRPKSDLSPLTREPGRPAILNLLKRSPSCMSDRIRVAALVAGGRHVVA